ncbi:MAG: OmpA family protein [Cyclobacteriaceae bacterium]|nr:OmpA family protein [Cyclobacteriaceae bacterium]
MRNILFLVVLLLMQSGVFAQEGFGNRILRNAKESTNRRVEQRSNQGVERGLDKAEEGIEDVFRKKEAGVSDPELAQPELENNDTQKSVNVSREEAGKKADEKIRAYSKFDFVPGEKVIFYDDYAADDIGDFPVNWNTNGSGEVVGLNNKEGKWLKMSGEGLFYPENLGVLPENVTIEFEIGTTEENQVQTQFHFIDSKISSNLLRYEYANIVEIMINALGGFYISCRDGESAVKLDNNKSQGQYYLPDKPFVNVSIWRQGTRLRMYLNEEKIIDLPRAFEKGIDYRMAISTTTHFLENREAYLGPLRVASGNPDTRSKLITEGKLSTTGIRFDSGSDKIKPESYGVLKEIANVLKENPGIKVKIIGHTDSDGAAASNLDLSRRRADAVKNALVSDFGIISESMTTDGKGQNEPVAANTSPEGKAQNRRVEFIKL